MVRAVIVYGLVALFSVLEAAIMNTEFIPASLLVSVFIIPSVLLYVVIERFWDGWRPAKHVAFIGSLLPLSGTMLHAAIVGPEGKDVGRIFLFWYLSQGLMAYLLLVRTRRHGPESGPGDCRRAAPD